MKKSSLFLFASLACLAQPSSAQPEKIVADKIIAQVEDKIILSSEYEYYKKHDLSKGPLPECAWLEDQIIKKLLIILAANAPSLSKSELDHQLENQINFYINQYGSKEELEIVAGKSISQIKKDIYEPFRERMLSDKMRDKILDGVTVSPAEVSNFLEKIPRDSLPYIEPKLQISQIVFYPKAGIEAEQRLCKQLINWKKQVESGQKKFQDIARVYDEVLGSVDQGGQYAVNKHDKQWDTAWFAAVWKLKQGEVSPVVKSAFGLHIIQMVKRTGDDAVIRNILLIPPVTQAEINKVKNNLDAVRQKIVFGEMPFSKAVTIYSEDEDSKHNGGLIPDPRTGSDFVTIDQLDINIVKSIKGLKPGDISAPQIYKDDRQRDAVRIVLLKSKTDGHVENLKDDYEEIARQALEIKKEQVLQKWVKDHISGYYLAIDKSFSDCGNLVSLVQAAKASF